VEQVEETEPAAEEVIELTVWDIPESESYVQWWLNYSDEFNETHPNIHVTWESFEERPYHQKIESAIVAGTAPDIFYKPPGAIPNEWYRQGKTLALEDVIDTSAFTDVGKEACTIDGKMVCQPLYLAVSAFYYNKAQFAEVGVDPEDWVDPKQPTLDEFYAACDALKAEGYIPIALGNKDNYPLIVWMEAAMNRTAGTGPFWDALYGDGSWTHPSFVRGAEFAQDLGIKHDYLPEGFTGIGGMERYLMFTRGEGAMMYYGPWVIKIIDENAPEGFEYGMFKFPSFPEGPPESQDDLEAGLDSYWVSSATEHPEAVAEFLKGLTELDTAMSFMRETGFTPTIRGLVEEAQKEGDIHPATVQLLDYISEAQHLWPWWDWVMPPAVSEELMNNSQPLGLGQITPEEFCERLEAKAER